MAFEAAFMKAGNRKRLCEIVYLNGQTATVEPYMIFTNDRGKLVAKFYVIPVENGSAGHGWREQPVKDLKGARVLEDTFAPRADYEFDGRSKHPSVLFAIQSSRAGEPG